MFMVWRGWGAAVPFIAAFIHIAVQIAAEGISGDPGYSSSHAWIMIFSMALAAAAIWIIGSRLERKPGQIVIDKESGQEFELKSKNDLFWIPFKWWAIPLVILGALAATA